MLSGVLEWSLTAYGALFLAALALSDKSYTQTVVGRLDPHLMQLGMFLIVLPLLVTGSMLIWLTELYRIERVGAYLRARERACWGEALRTDLTQPMSGWEYPLLWETKIHGPEKELRNFFTGFALFTGALLFSVAIYLADVASSHRPVIFQILAYAGGAAVLILYLLVVPSRFKKNVQELRREFPEPPAIISTPDHGAPVKAMHRVLGLGKLYQP